MFSLFSLCSVCTNELQPKMLGWHSKVSNLWQSLEVHLLHLKEICHCAKATTQTLMKLSSELSETLALWILNMPLMLFNQCAETCEGSFPTGTITSLPIIRENLPICWRQTLGFNCLCDVQIVFHVHLAKPSNGFLPDFNTRVAISASTWHLSHSTLYI